MPFDLLPALVLFAFVSSITPGPNNLMLMTSGMNFGLTRTLPHLLGVTIGFMLMIGVIGLGFAEILKAAPAIGTAITAFGVAYLLYLAWRVATARPPGDGAPASASRPFSFIEAALFQWLNPKAWSMALTAVSAYLPGNAPVLGLALVVLAFGAVNLPSCLVWTLLGVRLRAWLRDPVRMRAFNITAALLLVASLYPVLADALAH